LKSQVSGRARPWAGLRTAISGLAPQERAAQTPGCPGRGVIPAEAGSGVPGARQTNPIRRVARYSAVQLWYRSAVARGCLRAKQTQSGDGCNQGQVRLGQAVRTTWGGPGPRKNKANFRRSRAGRGLGDVGRGGKGAKRTQFGRRSKFEVSSVKSREPGGRSSYFKLHT
jgi:hypothetical protein